MDERNERVGVRMSAAELARLDAIAEATQRDRSKVLRQLVRLATAQLDGGLELRTLAGEGDGGQRG